MSNNTPAISEDIAKFSMFKSERKRSKTKSVQSGYINFLYPTIKDKVGAFAYSSFYDDDEDARDDLYDELEKAYRFDPWLVLAYLQSIASDLSDLAIKAFKMFLENMRPKSKENAESDYAPPIDSKEYDFDIKGDFEVKKYPKSKMRYKKYDMSYSKDNKGQSDFEKSFNTRRFESEKSSSNASSKSKSFGEDLSTKVAQESLAGEGGCSNSSWGSADYGCFGEPTPCDYGYCMEP